MSVRDANRALAAELRDVREELRKANQDKTRLQGAEEALGDALRASNAHRNAAVETVARLRQQILDMEATIENLQTGTGGVKSLQLMLELEAGNTRVARAAAAEWEAKARQVMRYLKDAILGDES